MAITKRKRMKSLDRLMVSISKANSKNTADGRLIGAQRFAAAGKAGVWCGD